MVHAAAHSPGHAQDFDTFDMLTRAIEVDEAYIGGKWENKPLRVRSTKGKRARPIGRAKTAVFGMVERGGRVRAWKVADTQHKTLLPKLRSSIHHDATVYTDSSVALHAH